MRRPFILFLLVISIYCWLTDGVNLLFFAFAINFHSYLFIGLISLLLLAVLFFVLRKFLPIENIVSQKNSLFEAGTKNEWLLLFVVSSPVILLGFFRAIYPDQNYDTYHFELYLQEYNFGDNAKNFAAGSIRSYYFPLPERIFSLFRHILGYRLGTVFNTFLLVTIIFSIYDFIKKICIQYLPNTSFPSVLVAILSLFALFADNTLFNIGSYKPDLIGVPLILELIYIVFFQDRTTAKRVDHFYFFLVASLSVAYKLTFLPYTGLLVFFYFLRNLRFWSRKEVFTLPLLILVFPVIYMLYNFIQTGNPIFPFYNKIFHSIQYPNENFKDVRWGPTSFHEIFIYPFVTFKDNSRCNEWGLFSYRLLVGYVIVIISMLVFLVGNKKVTGKPFLRFVFYFSVLTLLFDYACIITTAYYRYGIIVEICYGIIISLWFVYFNRRIISFFLLLVMFLQTYTTFNNIYYKQLNLSWHNYKELVQNKSLLKTNAGLIFHDYGQIIDSGHVLNSISGFVNVNPFPQDGLGKLLKNDAIIYDLEPWARKPELINQFEMNVVRPNVNKGKWVSIASIQGLNAGIIAALNKRGYLVSNLYEVYPDFMKYGEPVFLLELKYKDTAKNIIKTSEQYLRDENPKELRNDFTYKTGNKLISFIREAPYTYAWDFLPNEYDIFINDKKYTTVNRFGINKILSISDTTLVIRKPNSVPYYVIVQELIEK